ncbi:MAG: GspH/FimT family pseudopilin [Sandaracinaceae bacterium]
MQSRREKTEGFTLMEAMVVVAIIAITAALAAPGLSRTMADRRAGEATHSMVRIGARARSEALAYGRAIALVYSQDSTSAAGDDGSVEMWRGNLDRCSANDWGSLITADCSANPRCVGMLDMGEFDYPNHSVRMRMVGGTAGTLCFQPDGDMVVSTGGPFSGVAPGGSDAVRFNFTRLESGTSAGVQRAVIFPFGGAPRILR